MIKIFKYLKSSVVSVLIIIALLIIQAFFDLTLPDYTSKIVNVGVQQSGIENAAITDIGVTSLSKLVLFMPEDDKKIILDNYYENGVVEGTKEIKYSLKKGADKQEISNILAKPMMILTYLKNGNNAGFTLIDVPEGTDVFSFLLIMDKDKRAEVLTSIEEKVKDIPDTIVNSTAVTFVKEEYIRLGINVSRIQNLYIIKVGILMLGISLATMAVGILTVFVGSRMAAKLGYILREKVFKKVVEFSKNEIKTFGQSSLITRTTNDIQQVQSIIVFLLRVVFYAPIIGIGGVIKALNTNASMTYIIGIAVFSWKMGCTAQG